MLALDYRGRGRSDYDRDPNNYSFAVEMNDIVAVMTALEVGPSVFIGTSRGGILTMLLAAQRPALIAGAVLNDIGPVIDLKGLMRIKNYIGKLPVPKDYDEGAIILRRLFDSQFPKLTGEQWLAFAQRNWQERNGRLVPAYDVKLALTLEGINLERSLPPLWKEFDALAHVPVMVVRGENSDILSTETVRDMAARHPGLTVCQIPDEGHAPLLSAPDQIARIARFVATCDEAHSIVRCGG